MLARATLKWGHVDGVREESPHFASGNIYRKPRVHEMREVSADVSDTAGAAEALFQ